MSQALAIFRTVTEKLKEQTRSFMLDLVKYEKIVKTDEEVVLRRPKTGIYVLDLYKLMKEFAVNMNEDEKAAVKDAFFIRSSNNFLDIEGIYESLDTILKQSSENIISDTATESELNEMFEQRVYR